MGHFRNTQSDAEEQQLRGRGERAKDPRFRDVPSPIHEQGHCRDPASTPKALHAPLLRAHFLMLMACFQSMTRIHFPQSLILEPKGLEPAPDSTENRPAEPPRLPALT